MMHRENTFQKLKVALCTYPVLANPVYDQRFVIRADASERGIGAKLLPYVGGQRRTIAFLSRKLQPRERNYSTIEKECLAIVWAIKGTHIYVYGREFDLQTDHAP